MAQLQIPLSIWLSASPQERDQYYLNAGFDPNLPVVDAGTDTQFVRFRQDVDPGLLMPEPTTGPGAGDDLRDFPGVPTATPVSVGPLTALDVGVVPIAGATLGATALAARLPSMIRPQYLTWLRGLPAGVTWSFASLPWWLRQALQGLGITAGAIIIDTALTGIDIPLVPSLPFGGAGTGAGGVDIQVGQMGGHATHGRAIIGSWNTNPKDPSQGVTFYRLVGGWLAVQKKSGSWKTWKPKKPIVLYADGAKDLKTMIKADVALNKQAKKLAAMLNRRAPKPRKTAKPAAGPIILGNSARVVDV